MNTPPPIRVALVEDQADFRSELGRWISGAGDLQLVAAVASAEAAIESLPALTPDVILMDIRLPGVDGIEAVRRLRPALPSAEFLMLTVVSDERRVFESLRAGATGYLERKTDPVGVLTAIRELHGGGSVMSPSIARKVILAFTRAASAGSGSAGPAGLTVREQEVLRHLRRGLLYKEIGDSLGISAHTVRTHIHHIYKKLHLRSRSEAIDRYGPDSTTR